MGVRTLGREDLPFAVDLTVQEGWFYTERELEVMLRLDPQGSFIFEEDEPLGFATCVTYGRTGVLGHLIVSKEGRGRRIGHALIDAAVEYMAGKGVESMVVIATDEAVRLYEKHGFSIQEPIVCQHSRLDDAVPRIKSPDCIPLRDSDLNEVVEIDAKSFGDDRGRLIRALHAESPERSFKVETDGRIGGVIMARPDHIGYNLGPWVCPGRDQKIARALFGTALSTMGDGKLYSGSFARNGRALTIMDGLARINEWRTTLMIRGKPRYDAESVFGIAAFELG